MSVDLIFWDAFEDLLFSPLMAGNHSLEIDGGVEWLQVLLVISFSVELKNFNL